MSFKKGNTYGKVNVGRKLTDEHKEKLRQAHLGMKSSEEHKRKISNKMKGRVFTPEWKAKISEALKGVPRPQQSGDKNGSWKEKPKYRSMHSWVERNKGKACKCTICRTKTAKKYEWANVDHLYSRNLDDYIELCTKCHRRFDNQITQPNAAPSNANTGGQGQQPQPPR